MCVCVGGGGGCNIFCFEDFSIHVTVVVVLWFFVSTTAKVIRRRDLGLKSHLERLEKPGSNSRPQD